MNIGILVIGFMRPKHLGSVLESLKLQNLLGRTHVWIDGQAGRSEFTALNKETVKVAQSYAVKDLHVHNGHYGIEKIMLDALKILSETYDAFIVLEDDCFPLKGFFDVFESALKEIKGRDDIFSVYGHHFKVPDEGKTFSRFQGWGWATTSAKMKTLLPEMDRLFMLPEQKYLDHIEKSLTSDVRAALDKTPGRDVLKTMQFMFSWDSCLSLLCAQRGLLHRKTQPQSIVSMGVDKFSGHFNDNINRYRLPPFNMVSSSEVWDLYETGMKGYSPRTRPVVLELIDKVKARMKL
ncbi:MAG: hypothetical protein KDJ35_00155 [Alphaproteobacteria bacterium]|nr:hypothetical protein [Alphaproteobacteria bacterium]